MTLSGISQAYVNLDLNRVKVYGPAHPEEWYGDGCLALHPEIKITKWYDFYADTSTPIPNEQLREAVRLIERGKIDSSIIVKQDSIIAGQKRIITNKNTQLSIYLEKIKTYDNLVSAYKSQITQLNKAGTVSDEWIKALRKEVKQQRTQKTVVAILGILGIGTSIYLFAK